MPFPFQVNILTFACLFRCLFYYNFISDDGHLPDLVPFLRIFPVRIYVDIMMQVCINFSELDKLASVFFLIICCVLSRIKNKLLVNKCYSQVMKAQNPSGRCRGIPLKCLCQIVHSCAFIEPLL